VEAYLRSSSGVSGDRIALADHYRATRQALLAAIAALDDARMTERTIDGWSVKDHLAHIAYWDDLRAAEVERISSGYDSALRITAARGTDLNAIAYAARAELSLAQVRWELAVSRRRLLAAIEASTPRGMDASLYAEAGLRSGHEEEHTGWIVAWRRKNRY